jgi:hypothetical protein
MKRAQNGKPEGSNTKKVQKKCINRHRRQLDKKDPENSPKKDAFHGYTN